MSRPYKPLNRSPARSRATRRSPAGLGFAAWLLATEMLERLHDGGLFDLVDGARIIERARNDVDGFSAFVTAENLSSASEALGRLHVSWLRRHPGMPPEFSDLQARPLPPEEQAEPADQHEPDIK
jgi:hypothetical protein